jgi:hypothetical protein
MRKFLTVSAAIAGLAAAAPALAQGYPGSLPQAAVRAAGLYGEKPGYGEKHGGWLSAWLFGKATGSHMVVSERAPKAPALG